ncbi:MAG TPA: Ig-like domain-containing protein, partial [Gammaproteobacteria bacterium]|nr:Ig-like domain-containing protein [Gammaproteobacteria bacterium]
VDGRIAIGGAVYNLYLNPVGSPAADAGTAAAVTVNSSILANSLQGTTLVSDCENNAGAFTSGHDVVQTDGSSNCSFIDNDQTADPQLSPLTDNGGPTETLALTLGSVAVDAGDTGTSLGPVPLVDQRGFPRDSQPDVGAYEYQHPAVTGLADVVVSVGEAIAPQAFTLLGTGVLTVSVESSNADLLPKAGVTVSTDCGIDDSHHDCTLTLVPVKGRLGATTVTATVADAHGESAEQSFSLAVTNAAPSASSGSISTTSGKAVSGTLAASDPDAGQTLTFSIATRPAHGTVTLDASSGAFTYTPASDYAGSDSFAYTVNDGYESSAAAVMTIAVTALSDSGDNTDNASPPSPASSGPSSSLHLSGGGGALSFLGFALLGLPLLKRRRRM